MFKVSIMTVQDFAAVFAQLLASGDVVVDAAGLVQELVKEAVKILAQEHVQVLVKVVVKEHVRILVKIPVKHVR